MITLSKIFLLTLGSIFLLSFSTIAQLTYTSEQLSDKLDSMSNNQSGLNNEVQLNVSNIEMVDLLNSIGLENNLNLSVDPNLVQLVTYNFYDVPVKDVFTFLYRNYDIQIEFVGSIISFKNKPKVQKTPPKYIRKEPDVKYNPENEFLSVDLSNDTLQFVVHEITELSGKNIVIDNKIKNNPVSGYFVNRPIDEVLEMVASANGLVFEDKNNTFYLNEEENLNANNRGGNNSRRNTRNNNQSLLDKENFQLTNNNDGTLSIDADEVPIRDIMMLAAKELQEHYFLYDIPEGNITLSSSSISFEKLLHKLLNGTPYSFEKEDRVFIIGEQNSESLRQTELIKLEYRTVENIMELIPKELVNGLEIFEFLELNGLVVSGSSRRIKELKNFLYAIDQVVAMVQIDIIILYSQKGSDLATGIKAALDAENQETSGEVFPEYDMNFNSTSLNAIIDALNGFGNLNLGKVTSDFFVSLQALESNNVVETESTPKISTLNGHQASISIGEQRYYQEERVQVSNVVGNANVQNSRIWKQIEASLEVEIKPFVSSDEHVTLEISVGQNDFGEQVDPTAPPNKTTQTFQSFVRVKNGEVILMGGLEKKSSRDTGSGVPILSRIPILKWFLSSRSKSKEKSKLHILIRPTVTY
ncbi:MAG: type II and III secretion system protein [Brumimicrobium sp.]